VPESPGRAEHEVAQDVHGVLAVLAGGVDVRGDVDVTADVRRLSSPPAKFLRHALARAIIEPITVIPPRTSPNDARSSPMGVVPRSVATHVAAATLIPRLPSTSSMNDSSRARPAMERATKPGRTSTSAMPSATLIIWGTSTTVQTITREATTQDPMSADRRTDSFTKTQTSLYVYLPI
jgi:hypothetical protein